MNGESPHGRGHSTHRGREEMRKPCPRPVPSWTDPTTGVVYACVEHAVWAVWSRVFDRLSLNTAGWPHPLPGPAAVCQPPLPEPGLLAAGPSSACAASSRSPLRRGHSGGGIHPQELQASTPTPSRDPQPAQEQCGQRKHHGQSAPQRHSCSGPGKSPSSVGPPSLGEVCSLWGGFCLQPIW